MKILHFVLYNELYPPKNGGMLRCWNMIVELSRKNEVDVVTFQQDIGKAAAGFRPGLPSTTKFLTPIINNYNTSTDRRFAFTNRIYVGVKYRWYFKTFSSTDSSLLALKPLLKSVSTNTYDV